MLPHLHHCVGDPLVDYADIPGTVANTKTLNEPLGRPHRLVDRLRAEGLPPRAIAPVGFGMGGTNPAPGDRPAPADAWPGL